MTDSEILKTFHDIDGGKYHNVHFSHHNVVMVSKEHYDALLYQTEVLPAELIAWWESSRPVGYSLIDHIMNPIVNLSTKAEMGLAHYIADKLKKNM